MIFEANLELEVISINLPDVLSLIPFLFQELCKNAGVSNFLFIPIFQLMKYV